eukprot:3075625-Prymnesium_polylepis.1
MYTCISFGWYSRLGTGSQAYASKNDPRPLHHPTFVLREVGSSRGPRGAGKRGTEDPIWIFFTGFSEGGLYANCKREEQRC